MPKFTSATGKAAGKQSGKTRKKKIAAKSAKRCPTGPATERPTDAPLPSRSERRKLIEQASWWALNNDLDAEAPSPLHRAMQEERRRGGPAFLRQVIEPATGKSEGNQPSDNPQDGVRDFLANVNQMLDEIEKESADIAPGTVCRQPQGPAVGPTKSPMTGR